MDEVDFDTIFINNLKALGADFKSLKLPTDSSALGPLLACYNRAVDNQLKNIFHMWIKELPIILETCIERGDFGDDVGVLDDVDDYVHEYLENISKIHSRSSVTEKLTVMDQSFSPEDQSDILKRCLEYTELEPSTSQDVAIQELAAFQLKHWNEFQDLKKRMSSLYSEWLTMQPLYSYFASVCEDPHKITATDLKDPVMSISELLKVSGEIFTSVRNFLLRYNDAESETSSDLMWCCNSISRLIESEKFSDLKKINISTTAISSKLDTIINRLHEVLSESTDFFDASGDPKERPSTDNSSTNSSLILKSPFSPVLQSPNQTVMKTSTEPKLDTQLSPIKSFSNVAIGNTLLEVNDEVRLIDPDDRTKESTPASILKSSHAFELDYGKDSINDPGADFKLDEVPAKSILKLSSFSFSPENSNFADDEALFNDINNELASLLHTTTLQDRQTSNEDEDNEENLKVDTGEFKLPLKPEIPPITPPLVPSRLSNPRASLKSLRFGTPISSERKIVEDGEYVDENQNEPVGCFSVSPYFKSFSEFARDSTDPVTSKPSRPPFTLINSNFENNPRLSELLTFADLCPKSPINNDTGNRIDEITKSDNETGEDDESLGLLSRELQVLILALVWFLPLMISLLLVLVLVGDMDNPDSELLLSQ
ncbi:hypothetical protein ACTXT7_004495 [Hymenolepis weldensis]